MEYFSQSLKLYRFIGDERGEAEILGCFGAVYFELKDLQTAISYYQEALRMREKVDDRQLMGNSLNGIGSVYLRSFNDYHRLWLTTGKAEAIREEIGDLTGLRATLDYKAYAYLMLAEELKNAGHYSEALTNLEKSWKYAQKRVSGSNMLKS